jgi:hypothetical protein
VLQTFFNLEIIGAAWKIILAGSAIPCCCRSSSCRSASPAD